MSQPRRLVVADVLRQCAWAADFLDQVGEDDRAEAVRDLARLYRARLGLPAEPESS